MDRQDVIDRIEFHLAANTTPPFRVIAGEPIGLPPDQSPFACFWYMGEVTPEEGRMTFGNVMVYERFQVMCLWHRHPELVTWEALEKEIWDANRSLKSAFRGDSTLNNEATDLMITDSQVDMGLFPLQGQVSPPLYRTLEFELRVKDLEAEAIAP